MPRGKPSKVFFSYKTKPYKFQKELVESTAFLERHGLFLDMGLGKTKVIIDTAKALFCGGYIRSVLVVAPKGMYHQWPGEIAKHYGPYRPGNVYLWDHRKTKKEKRRRDEFMSGSLNYAEGLQWLIVNVEALRPVSKKPSVAYKMAEMFLNCEPNLMVVDESTTIKNPKACQTKAVRKLGGIADYRRVLTGTPCPQSPLDLYSQMAFLDETIFGVSYWAFRSRYAELKDQYIAGGKVVKVVSGYKRLAELQQVVSENSTRYTKDECLDLPPKIYSVFNVEFTSEQKKLYTQMKERAFVELDNETLVTAPLAISRLMKLRQILSGFVFDASGHASPIKHNRVTALKEVLGYLSGKVVIWCSFLPSVQELVLALKAEFGPECFVTYTGIREKESRLERQKRFTEDPDCNFLIGTAQTGNRGLNLSAYEVVYYDNTFDLETRLQSEDRCHGIGRGSNKPVTYVDLLIEGTIDQKIRDALIAKKRVQDELVGDGWKEWLT